LDQDDGISPEEFSFFLTAHPEPNLRGFFDEMHHKSKNRMTGTRWQR
jgi:hypothetical protein